jgi:putative IMPACT (imprinted ancient) family translation regulator
VKAVESWRGSKNDANSFRNTKRMESTSVGESAISPSATKASLIAENLAKQLDAEQKQFLDRIEKQKADAEGRLLQVRLLHDCLCFCKCVI